MGAKILLSLALTFLTQPCWAAQTGKKAAQKYFVKKGEEGRSTASTSITSAGNYKGLFTLSAGTLFASKSYNWAEQQSPTGWSLQLDYHRRLKSSFFHVNYIHKCFTVQTLSIKSNEALKRRSKWNSCLIGKM